MTNCLFFGDSITYGEYDGFLGGWVDYLKRYCHLKYSNENANEVSVFNLGIGGETTDGLIKRFENELIARKSTGKNLVFYSFGANDLVVSNGENLVPLKNYKQNLLSVIKKTKEVTNEIYLISITPISEKIDGKINTLGNLRTNQLVINYNKILMEIAHEENINYVDIHTDFNKQKENFLSKDNVHPNEKGYEFIANKIKPIISKHL